MNKKWAFYALFGGVAVALGFFLAKMDLHTSATAPKTTGVTSATSVPSTNVRATQEAEAPPPWGNRGTSRRAS